MNEHSLLRIRAISLCVFLLFALIIGKLYMVQVVDSATYLEKADHQYLRATNDLFDRGSIFFTLKDGSEITAAGLKSGFTVAINPTRLTDPGDAYKRLSALMTLDWDSFMGKALKKKDPYEEVAKKVDEGVGEAIDAAQIPGVSVYKERWRYYPGGTTAAHTLGFLSYEGNQGSMLGAHYGLEKQYDSTLSRQGDQAFANFFTEILYGIQKTAVEDKGLEGDIVSTIEPTVQGYLEDEIKKTNATYSSQETGGIVIDPTTGAIYAMALTPSFDPNDIGGSPKGTSFGNHLVESVYEMGSIVKPLTVAAGVDAGVITPDTLYDDKGSVVYDGSRIWNYDKKARGVINIQTALENSLNVGMAHIVELLGQDKFTEYFKKFGIAEKTGIDLPNEAAPLAKNLDSPRMIEHATASFGQGIAFSPVGITKALSTLANGGYLITPHVVSKINYKVGVSKTLDFARGEQVIKPETAATLTTMLVRVVDKALLGGEIKEEHYAIAAKTGTAQIANPAGGGYYADRYLHSFFGYFPAYKPRFLVFLYTVYPKGVEYASHTLTAPFNDLAKFLLSYYNVPPDR